MNGKEIRYFSMFTGVGGFELGLERTNNDSINTGAFPHNERLQSSSSKCNGDGGRTYSNGCEFKCIGFSEIDKYANQLLAKRFPNIPNFGDCTKINPTELPDFDMLCGGFPCQSFSIAGKRRGFEDTRGTMFFEIARIVKVKRPRLVFLENVKGLLNHDKGETFKVILQTLEELGYRTQWMVLNSKFFGVPQNRERVFIIGSLRGEPRPEILPFGKICESFNEQDISHTLPSSYYKITRGTTMINDSEIGIEKRQNGKRFKEDGDELFTLTKTDIHGVSDGFKIRRLTPIECERLQGFPDGWTSGFSDTQRYKMMGNAVTVNVIKAIAEKLL